MMRLHSLSKIELLVSTFFFCPLPFIFAHLPVYQLLRGVLLYLLVCNLVYGHCLQVQGRLILLYTFIDKKYRTNQLDPPEEWQATREKGRSERRPKILTEGR